MSENTDSNVGAEQAERAVDAILERTGFPVSAAERERLIRFYPLVGGWMERLRTIEARDAEPVLIYPAAPRG